MKIALALIAGLVLAVTVAAVLIWTDAPWWAWGLLAVAVMVVGVALDIHDDRVAQRNADEAMAAWALRHHRCVDPDDPDRFCADGRP